MSRQHGSTESVGAPRGVRKQVSHGFLDILGLPKLQNCPELRGPRLEGLLPPVPHGILDILKPRGALFCLRFRGTRAVHARAPLAYGAADPSTRPWTRGPWFRRASQQNSRQSGVCTTRGPSNSDPTVLPCGLLRNAAPHTSGRIAQASSRVRAASCARVASVIPRAKGHQP